MRIHPGSRFGSPTISILLPGFNVGGAERVLLSIAGELAKRGYACDVVSTSSGGVWRDRIPSGVRLVELCRSKPLHAIFDLWKYLRQEQPTVLFSSITNANIAALLATRMPGVRTRCVIREANTTEFDISDNNWTGRTLNKIALRCLYPHADALIALSEGIKRSVCTISKIESSKISVIPNPHLPVSSHTPVIHKKTSTEMLLIACGRLEPQKDFSTLIAAFACVRKRVNARLAILGVGYLASVLSNQAKKLGVSDFVDFIGHSPEPATWMRSADLFVLSSRWEGFPNVLMEALANGCAVVATDCSDAVGEILDHGRYGRICRVGDIDDMAVSILDVLEGRQTFPRADAHLRNYDLSAITDRYLSVLLGEAHVELKGVT